MIEPSWMNLSLDTHAILHIATTAPLTTSPVDEERPMRGSSNLINPITCIQDTDIDQEPVDTTSDPIPIPDLNSGIENHTQLRMHTGRAEEIERLSGSAGRCRKSIISQVSGGQYR